jgi:prefoldin alpha subunit
MTKEVTVPSGGASQAPSQQQFQEQLMLFQLMEKQLEVLKQQINMAESRIIEIETTKSALHDIKDLKEGNETLIPLGSGLYTHAKITNKEILTELGARVMVKQDIPKATAFLEERKVELDKAAKHIEAQAIEITERLQELGPELQKMAAQVQK